MDWLYYLLEANLYLLIFYGFYRLLLQNQTFYNSNRYYLLLSSLAAFALPVLQIGYLKPRPEIVEQAVYSGLPVAHQAPGLSDYLYLIYMVVALAFAIKLFLSIAKIISLWQGAKKYQNEDFTLVELQQETEAFSFFNLLFIHPHLAEKQVVLKHELVHIKQKHSIDVLFFELMQVVCWFNPIIYFIKKDIKLLHEYIADERSASTSEQKHDYVMFLIENSFGIVPQKLTHQIFNQSILKRRINMLNKKRTAHWARLKLLLALPLGGAMLCTSTMAFTKDYGYVDLFPEKNKTIEALVQQEPKVENVKKQPVKVENIKVQEVKPDNIKKTKKGQAKFPPPSGKTYKTQLDAPAIEPPPPGVKTVKFPPPIVKRDKKAPAVEPPPPTVKTVKFPPPIVRRDKNAPAIEPPPPGAKKTKKDQVKFPPPVIRKDKKGNNDEADLKAKVAALPSVSIASAEPNNAKEQLYIKSAKENQIAAVGTEQPSTSLRSDSKVRYSIAVTKPQESLKNNKDLYPGTEQQKLKLKLKPSIKESKKEARQTIALELLPTNKQP